MQASRILLERDNLYSNYIDSNQIHYKQNLKIMVCASIYLPDYIASWAEDCLIILKLNTLILE